MTIYQPGARVKRNDNGRIVNVVEALPNGAHLFYRVEDARDGHTTIISARDVRPVTSDDLRRLAEGKA